LLNRTLENHPRRAPRESDMLGNGSDTDGEGEKMDGDGSGARVTRGAFSHILDSADWQQACDRHLLNEFCLAHPRISDRHDPDKVTTHQRQVVITMVSTATLHQLLLQTMNPNQLHQPW
jgi:hypothetical protein